MRSIRGQIRTQYALIILEKSNILVAKAVVTTNIILAVESALSVAMDVELRGMYLHLIDKFLMKNMR